MSSLRQQIGCWWHERLPAERVLSGMSWLAAGLVWQDLCNRHERLKIGSSPHARVCQWDDSSWLTLPKIFPSVGARLFRHCFSQWPIRLSDAPWPDVAAPRLSVILPVSGEDRIEQFRACAMSWRGQTVHELELVVIESDGRRQYEREIPQGARYQSLDTATGEYNKSAAMNLGVELARAPFAVLHDADVAVPCQYAEQLLTAFQEGWDAIRPIRWLFCLDQNTSARWLSDCESSQVHAVSQIQQNNPGLSTAVRTEAYRQIGGHDPGFVGWGGEDLEFLDRLKTRRLFQGGWLPTIHLWHPPAVKKATGHRNQTMLEERRKLAVEQRIAALTQAQL
jgi:hypothetical protein